MKIVKILLLFITLLFVTSSALAAKYTGFKEPAKGEWAILVMNLEKGREMEEKMVYLGEAMMNGKTVYGVEARIHLPQQQRTMISQFWTDKKTNEEMKFVMKQGEQLMCMSASMPGMTDENSKPMTKTPDEFSPDKPVLRYDTYTTPTGKKVHVAVFKSDEGEVWVSSDTPFGIVRMVKNGKDLIYLKDFGSGEKPLIPVSDAVGCKAMDLGQMFGGFGGN